MVDVGLLKGKAKVLTSTKSREARAVDPERQISGKYRSTNTRELKDVATSKRADMSREKRQRKGRQSHELHLEFC